MLVKLEDVCIKDSSNIAQKDIENLEGDYPIYGASGFIKNIDTYKQEQQYLAIVKDGAGVGRVMLLPPKSSVIGTLQYLIPKNNIIPNYLFYVISNMKLGKYANGATIPHIYFKDYKKEEFELPSFDKQQKIVSILDQVNKIISLRTQQLEQLDLLIKSRFVEMFGTLGNPTKEFGKNILKNLCLKITDGKHGGCNTEKGTERYFIGAREIYNDEVHYDTAPEINLNEFEKDYKRCNVEIGDFLIVNTGATIGKSAIAKDYRTTNTLLQKSVALLKVKKDCLNSIFLKYCYSINKEMYLVENASAQPNLLLSRINNTEIYVPLIEEQNQFAAFVEEVEKEKITVKQSLEQLDILKKKLMQDYFG